MENREKLELTPDEQREADEYHHLRATLLAAARTFNGPNAPAITDLFPNARPVGELEAAATSGKLWRVKQALNAGADPNEPSAMFGTALHAAAMEGDLDIVQLLVEQGADPQRQDDEGQTPAVVAAIAGHQAVASYLRSCTPSGPTSTPPDDTPRGPLQKLKAWLRRRG